MTKRLSEQTTIADIPQGTKPTLHAAEELLHEFREHQIELEMQNEELRQSQMALEKSRDRYVDLYDFAPIGYITLTDKGLIAEINLTGATLLGLERSKLLRRRFSLFVVAEDRDRLHRHFYYALQHGGKQRCEMTLQRGNGEIWHAQLDCLHVTYEDEKPALRIALTDITEQVKVREEMGLHRLLVENSSDPAFVIDVENDFRMVYVNEAAVKHYGVPREEILTWRIPDWDANFTEEKLSDYRKAVEKNLGCAIESLHRVKGGKLVPVQISVNATRYKGRLHHVGYFTNISQRKKIEEELRIAAVTFNSREGIIVTDANKVIQRVNKAFTQLTGYSAEEVIGKTPSLLSSGRQGAEFYQAMWQIIQLEDFWQGEIWNRRKSGEIYPEWLTITAIKDDDGCIINYVGTFTDITERKEAEEQVRNLAFYDALTKLPNRRLLLDRLSQAQARSARGRQHGALMFLDMDRFKLLNDTHGHSMGDQLLLEVAQRLQNCVRKGDTVARLGGDEFVVMLAALDEYTNEAAVQTQLVAEKIRAALAKPYLLSTHAGECETPFVYHSSASIGVVLFQGYADSVEELMKRADLAMYEAKHGGRDAVCVFDPAMQLALNARAILEEHMRAALDQQFRLHYQMQVDEQGNIVGVEALIRWQHPERGLLQPTDFIPLAEETGLIVPIGKWVLQAACAQLRVWENNPMMQDLMLAINISAYQFRQTDFVEHVLLALEQTGANAERLELEITESLLLYDIDDTIAKMRQLKKIGVKFAMDDFGTGYSSLSNLQRLPLDQIKIDQSFIRDMDNDANDAAIVNAILTMGKSLGIEVVAEGVETKSQRDYLIQRGCPTCQGYLFGRPCRWMSSKQHC